MKEFFDHATGKFGVKLNKDILMDDKGHLLQELPGGMAMDLKTGKLHPVSDCGVDRPDRKRPKGL